MTIDPNNGLPLGFIADPLPKVAIAPPPTPPAVTPAGSSNISPAASFLSQLDQIQQQSPTQYSNVATSIATELQADAAAAQKNGNTAQAKTLTQLATEFQSSAKTGQVPSAQVLQKALAGHHGHHHGQDAEASASSMSTSTATPTSTAASTASLLGAALSNAMSSIVS
jgi:hypothetical protein